ncbi:MAG: ArsI/CadI family heavy metal resistance metalloenzyme [Pseudomonadota bacterium]
MKRMHIHIGVNDLDKNIEFYSTMFGCHPVVLKQDYAKWRLEDPAVNFAISVNEKKVGLDHFGIEADTEEELTSISSALKSANINTNEQKGASCCYANSHKYWSFDPQELAWESFVSFGDSEQHCSGGVEIDGDGISCCIPSTLRQAEREETGSGACCIPQEGSSCCN